MISVTLQDVNDPNRSSSAHHPRSSDGRDSLVLLQGRTKHERAPFTWIRLCVMSFRVSPAMQLRANSSRPSFEGRQVHELRGNDRRARQHHVLNDA